MVLGRGKPSFDPHSAADCRGTVSESESDQPAQSDTDTDGDDEPLRPLPLVPETQLAPHSSENPVSRSSLIIPTHSRSNPSARRQAASSVGPGAEGLADDDEVMEIAQGEGNDDDRLDMESFDPFVNLTKFFKPSSKSAEGFMARTALAEKVGHSKYVLPYNTAAPGALSKPVKLEQSADSYAGGKELANFICSSGNHGSHVKALIMLPFNPFANSFLRDAIEKFDFHLGLNFPMPWEVQDSLEEFYEKEGDNFNKRLQELKAEFAAHPGRHDLRNLFEGEWQRWHNQ